jgi:hypothetical protein
MHESVARELEEGHRLRAEVDALLERNGLRRVPANIHLFCGDVSNGKVHETIRNETGAALEEIDLFYTFPVGHDDYASLIAARGRPGSTFLVYGVNRVIPRHPGLELIEHLTPLNQTRAVYRRPA